MFEKKKISKVAHIIGASDQGNRFGGAGFQDFISPQGLEKWKPAEGVNRIDILPYNATASHPLVVTGQAEVGDGLYSLDIYVHRDIGPSHRHIPCLKQFGKNCPLCNEAARLRNLGTEEGQKASSELYARRRVVYLIHDLGTGKYGYWDTGYKSVEQKLNSAAEFVVDASGRKIDVYDWEEGRSVHFMGTAKTFNGNKFVEPDGFGFDPRNPLSDEVLAHSQDLSASLNMVSEEDMEKILAGGVVQTQPTQQQPTVQPVPQPASQPAPATDTLNQDLASQAMAAPVQPAAPAQPAPQQPAQAAPAQADGKVCPCGYNWGEADKHSECATCKAWENCIDG